MTLLALLTAKTPTTPSEPTSSLVAPYNASAPLDIPTVYTGPHGTHPDVVDMGPAGLNGYRYWMAYTPYDNEVAARENPSIIAGNTPDKLVTPPGVTNPVIAPPAGAGATNYNSDTDMVWDGSKLVLHWREVRNNSTEIIQSVSSTDGVTWGDRRTQFETGALTNCLSPAIVRGLDGGWRMFAMADVGRPWTVRTAPAADGPWSAPQVIPTVPPVASGGKFWHLDVIRHKGQYRALLMHFAPFELYAAVSDDGVNFRRGPRVLAATQTWEDRLYRSTFVPADNGLDYDLWYGVIGSGWRLAYTRVPMSLWDGI